MKNQLEEFPLDIKISFHKIIEQYRKQVEKEPGSIARNYMEELLEYIGSFPELSEGIEDAEDLKRLKDPIRILLDDLFPGILTDNEIKAASLPFHNIIFNPSNRLKNLLNAAGEDYVLEMRELSDDMKYIYGCILVLNHHYNYGIDFSRPLYYDIPDKNGIVKHYRLALNADFLEIFPGKGAKEITDKDVDQLIQNIDDVSLWKEKFPPRSWIFKGFTILNLTDVTVDDAISRLKTTLLQQEPAEQGDLDKFQEVFRSIYKISDLKVGFTIYNKREMIFERMNGREAQSFILHNQMVSDCKTGICENSFRSLIEDQSYFTIANVDSYARKTGNNLLAQNLKESNIKSCILAPIASGQELLGVLELVSFRKNELNSINAIKLDDILPYIVTAVQRNRSEFENRIKAVIQSECTSIHPSVLWIFEKEAKRFIKDMDEDGLASFKDIAFKDVYPLYGQIDIVASSEARNTAIQKDLIHQLEMVENIIEKANEIEGLPIYDQVRFRIREFMEELKDSLNASSEQKIFNLLQKEVNPIMDHIKDQSADLEKLVLEYQKELNPETGVVYIRRKHYDETVQRINRTMARFIDRQQVAAQSIYPHYFERYKTDGVDHNMYIGASLTFNRPFNMVYLYNLRLWQLRTMCEMENRFYQIQQSTPISLDAASLILVFNTTLSIRYRMDEKKFDVDGTYNARYEIIKKRIDKAFIKNTEERITQKGKIVVVYSQSSDEREYLRYVKYLQTKNYLGDEIELLELEDVQGVIGLKAIRVNILYTPNEQEPDRTITYEGLMEYLDEVKGDHKTYD
ncbi:GAF domain-containing protein [Antarcticibacterium flavum]|uniref:GAF domain-containing protein n=1 Tax=Antarcticibacterium flavum TaxID=2058175 RepID=A0A5B7X1Z4_9FLAO|nr:MULTISPECIES: GAF domain-containing protein [Antarcticibacterium]MCM4158799.1 GAF domain-containing protein [Antarcticibacterium sp. W02-3]QCY68648.1 GAF domain-containing protein [Antarcticibacterium flavum]